MNDLLIGYLMDTLDEPEMRQVEAYLEHNPEARRRLAIMQQALEPLSADDDAPPPPPDLIERTLAKVAAEICAPDKPFPDLPMAPPVSPTAATAGRSWWRRADILVAACLLITAVGISMIVLYQIGPRSSSTVEVECKNNLRQFYMGLQSYHEQHRHFPDVSREAPPYNVAGMMVPILMDAGVLPPTTSIRCPGIGEPLACHLSLESLRTLSDEDFEKYSPSLLMCYAYSLGYRNKEGVNHPPGSPIFGSLSQMPLMADRPPAEGVLMNSINHGGDGQNVLFADGHVRFLTDRTFRSDDIYLNRKDRVAAGTEIADIVLGYSSARP